MATVRVGGLLILGLILASGVAVVCSANLGCE